MHEQRTTPVEQVLDNVEGLAVDLGIAERRARSGELKIGHWISVRAAILVVALIAAVGTLLARSERYPASWEEHLARQGAHHARALTWLEPPEPGRWALGLVEAVPAEVGEHGPGAPPEDGARDIYLFEGLLNGAGEPFSVRRLGNITRTPDGDDTVAAVDTSGRRWFVATATQRGETYTGLDLFDLHGDRAMTEDELGEPRSAPDRLRIALIHFQDHGRAGGVGRRSFAFARPVRDLKVEARDGVMLLSALDEEEGRVRGHIRAHDAEVLEPIRGAPLTLVEQTEPWVLGSWTTYTVNRVRNIPWIGPGKIAALEHAVFTTADLAKQAYYGVVGHDNSDLKKELAIAEAIPAEEQAPPAPKLAVAEGAVNVSGERAWPPADITPRSNPGLEPIPNEGKWAPWVPPWRSRAEASDGTWPYYRTALRVNPKRQHDYTVLVAMDLRQLQLNMVAGVANPTSTTGTRGTGLLPNKEEVFKDDFVVFNGGFKTDHGAYGMMVDRRTIIPAKAHAATIAINDRGQVLMGTWAARATHEARDKNWRLGMTSENAYPVPDDVHSYRQNLPPLMENETINPAGLHRWGGVVSHLNSSTTPRSSVCLKGDSTLIYIWGSATSAEELGEAHLMAGCTYSVHLDMNPIHTSMIMHRVPLKEGQLPPTDKKTGYVGAMHEPAATRMYTDWYRYLKRSSKDFFYVTPRKTLAGRLGERPAGYSLWSSRGLPVAYKGLAPMALVGGTSDITLLALDSERFDASVVEGGRFEPGEGVRGELHVGIMLDGAEEAPAPWLETSDFGRVSSFQGLNVSPEGRLSVVDGGEVVVPTPARLLPGKPLIVAGAPIYVGDEDGLGSPIVAASNAYGDVVLGTCKRCALREMVAAFAPLKPTSMVLLGKGSVFATTSGGGDGEWVAAIPHDAPNPALARLKLVPGFVPPRAIHTDFKTETTTRLAEPR